jgi:hypothetical protein
MAPGAGAFDGTVGANCDLAGEMGVVRRIRGLSFVKFADVTTASRV